MAFLSRPPGADPDEPVFYDLRAEGLWALWAGIRRLWRWATGRRGGAQSIAGRSRHEPDSAGFASNSNDL